MPRRMVGLVAVALVTLCLAPGNAHAGFAGWFMRPPAPVEGVGYAYFSVFPPAHLVPGSEPVTNYLWLIDDRVSGFRIRPRNAPFNCLTQEAAPAIEPCQGGSAGTAVKQLWNFYAVVYGTQTIKRAPVSSATNRYQIRPFDQSNSCLGVHAGFGSRAPVVFLPCSTATVWRLGFTSAP